MSSLSILALWLGAITVLFLLVVGQQAAHHLTAGSRDVHTFAENTALAALICGCGCLATIAFAWTVDL
jgi:hypothetical protein